MTTTVPTIAPALRPCFRVYTAYKDSCVQGLTAIPAHWQTKPLKHVAILNLQVLEEATDPDYELEYVDIGNVNDHGELLEFQSYRFRDAPSRARRRVAEGDTIISTVRTYLKAIHFVHNVPGNRIVSTGFAVLRPRNGVVPRFLWRIVQSTAFVDSVVANSEGVSYPAINPSRLASLKVWLPPVEEQTAISDLLDQETGKIDALVARKERLIALLEHKRAALINRAVTRGLNPTVPMKDPGIWWLGRIPRHWQVKRLKYLVRGGLVNGVFKTKEHFGEGVKLINVVNIYQKDSRIDFEQLDRVVLSPSELRVYGVEPGDIFFVRSSLKLEGVAASALIDAVPEPAVFECHLVKIRPVVPQILPRFMAYYLNSTTVRQRLVSLAQTTTMTTIGQSELAGLEVTLPPMEEQVHVCEFLEEICGRLDGIIAKTREQITKLQEYRTAVISAAVTGKIDVRGTAA